MALRRQICARLRTKSLRSCPASTHRDRGRSRYRHLSRGKQLNDFARLRHGHRNAGPTFRLPAIPLRDDRSALPASSAGTRPGSYLANSPRDIEQGPSSGAIETRPEHPSQRSRSGSAEQTRGASAIASGQLVRARANSFTFCNCVRPTRSQPTELRCPIPNAQCPMPNAIPLKAGRQDWNVRGKPKRARRPLCTVGFTCRGSFKKMKKAGRARRPAPFK